jgi:hypothetical protein
MKCEEYTAKRNAELKNHQQTNLCKAKAMALRKAKAGIDDAALAAAEVISAGVESAEAVIFGLNGPTYEFRRQQRRRVPSEPTSETAETTPPKKSRLAPKNNEPVWCANYHI